MSVVDIVDRYASTVSANYTAGATSLSVTSASGLPTGACDFYVLVKAEGSNTEEVLHVTNISGTTLTVAGAQATTGASNHGIGAVIIGSIWTKAAFLSLIPSSYPYDIVASYVGKPATGATVYLLTAARTITLSANFSGSYGTVGINPTASAVFTVLNGATTIGTITVSTGGVVTFATTGGTSKTLNAGDRLSITAPSPQDATLSDTAFTIAGARS